MTKVKCTVNNCEFWGEGEVCSAEEILVKQDFMSVPDRVSGYFADSGSMEFGRDYETSEKKKDSPDLHSGVARSSPQTCCDTMKPKSKDSHGYGGK